MGKFPQMFKVYYNYMSVKWVKTTPFNVMCVRVCVCVCMSDMCIHIYVYKYT